MAEIRHNGYYGAAALVGAGGIALLVPHTKHGWLHPVHAAGVVLLGVTALLILLTATENLPGLRKRFSMSEADLAKYESRLTHERRNWLAGLAQRGVRIRRTPAPADFEEWWAEIVAWRDEVATWIGHNLGEAEQVVFLDTSNLSPIEAAHLRSERVDATGSHLERYLANLVDIIRRHH